MNKCSLCGKKISNTKYSFGLGCLKKSCSILNIANVKNLKGETTLNNKIVKICDKNNLNKEQKELLTNRYLTLKLLENIDIDYYNDIKREIKNDIENISSSTSKDDLKTMDTMPLKYAFNIYKLFIKYKSFEEMSNNITFDDIQNIDFNLVLFDFSSYYNKKPYLKGLLHYLQLEFWKFGIYGLKKRGHTCAAKYLEHSINYKPTDVLVQDNDEIIDKIKDDTFFKQKIKDIVYTYGDTSYFDTAQKNTKTEEKNKSLNYEKLDLFLALNNTDIRVIGHKKGNKWNLDITLTDVYDFTDFKELHEYFDGGILRGLGGSTAYNLAMFSTSCGLINEYNITIKFSMYDYEVV